MLKRHLHLLIILFTKEHKEKTQTCIIFLKWTMTQLFPYALNNANTEKKPKPKTEADELKENNYKAHRQPLSASIRNLVCSTPGSLFKSLCHTVFSRKSYHLPSQWVTGVSHNHRATFQAKFIFQGSWHCSESGRAESPGMPRNVAVSQELLSPAPAFRSLAG